VREELGVRIKGLEEDLEDARRRAGGSADELDAAKREAERLGAECSRLEGEGEKLSAQVMSPISPKKIGRANRPLFFPFFSVSFLESPRDQRKGCTRLGSEKRLH
jgi:hypothetical protein